ncbi:hypothetical protein EYF80_017416 [Liparis tanakae]|uniref:Uncharacterized protein n=1 Tax=Liparis tanakae TaxID=230148 RepID=A0A4Z2I319_9TELE|nr:hypothetical protein EYF80_017416 [Liparis tanakae]
MEQLFSPLMLSDRSSCTREKPPRQQRPKISLVLNRFRIFPEGFSTLQVLVEAMGRGGGLTTAPCDCFLHGPVVHVIISSLGVLHINKADPTIAASFLSR